MFIPKVFDTSLKEWVPEDYDKWHRSLVVELGKVAQLVDADDANSHLHELVYKRLEAEKEEKKRKAGKKGGLKEPGWMIKRDVVSVKKSIISTGEQPRPQTSKRAPI